MAAGDPWRAAACQAPHEAPALVHPLPRRVVGRCDPPRTCRAAEPAEAGQWRLLDGTTEVLAVHAALLPTGRVLLLAGSGNDHNYRSGVNAARLFDPATERIIGAPEFAGAEVPPNDPPTLHDNDVFCAGHSLLPDGRLLVVGGNLEYPTGWVHRTPGVRADLSHDTATFDHPLPYDNPEIARPSCHGFLGLRESLLFDPASESWGRAPKMARGRWYPSTLILDDGRALAINGLDDVGAPGCRSVSNKTVEIFDPASATWTPPLPYPGGWPDERYPYLHLLPSGYVFYAGPTAETRIFDPETLATLGAVMPTTRGARDNGASLLLPLRPEDGYAPRVLNVGGAPGFSRFGVPEAEIIDLSVPSSSWRAVAPMAHGRVHAPSTLLPDGTVLVLGGSAISEVEGQGVLEAERFDPATETWSSAGVAALERHYHSVAVLLPDGRVWVAGGNPNRDPGGPPDPYDVVDEGCPIFGQPCHGNPHDGHGNNELRMEIYSPPYLFRGPRPEVVAAPDAVPYGAELTLVLGEDTDAATIERVVLIRPAATTHARNMDHRAVELVRRAASAAAGTVTVLAPPAPAVAPPGYYMLFAVDTAGVPSVARFVRLALEPARCDGEPDLDDDGIGDRCDEDDARFTLRRFRARASRSRGKPNGRVSMTARASSTADALHLRAGDGLGIRVRDAAHLDLYATLGASRCSPCGRHCVRCKSADGSVRVGLRASRRATAPVRITASLRGLDIDGPFTPPVTVALTVTPPLPGAGIDWVATPTRCLAHATRLLCRE